MFKSARWGTDKNKITALFKLRFHAAQVAQLGGNALVLSLVPADTGKPTAKLEKSEIRDGCCYWDNPIFETVKFVQDPKTGKIHERIYYFIISRGSSKSSVLGEVSVNMAEYAGATKAASISLPFKGFNSDVFLHVLIQRIQENANPRELEECEGANIKLEEWNLKRHFSNGDLEENVNINSNHEVPLRKTVSNELIGYRRASFGSNITLSCSDSSSGSNTPRELGMKNNNMLLDSIAHNQKRMRWELSMAPAYDSSTDDSTISPREDAFVEKLKSNLVLLSRKAEVADLELQTLRKQVVKESKRGQDLSKEIASLKEERDALKEECEKLKASQKCKDELKARNKLNYEGDPWTLLEETRQELNYEKGLSTNLQLQLQKTQESNSELILAVQELEQMLEQSKGENFGLSNPVCCKIPEVLEEKCLEVQGLSDDDEEQKALEEIVKQHTDAREAYILEQKIMDLCSEIEMYRRDKDELEMQMEQLALDYEILKQENHDMSHKLHQSHLQEQLKLQYESSCSYAIINDLENRVQKLEKELMEQSNELSDSFSTIKELENHIHNLEDELEKQAQGFKDELEVVTCAKMEKEQQAIRVEEAHRSAKLELGNQIKKLEDAVKKISKEYSDALSTIKELADQIQSLEDDLDKQAQGFESDLEAVTCAKVEQEQRAIRAEEALRLTRWKNANTAGRIQDEFKRLSMQMQSTFEANEKAALKAMTEASELRLVNKHLEELLQHTKEELQSVKDDYEAQVSDLCNQLTLKSKQIDEMLLDIEEKSNQLNHQREYEQVKRERENLECAVNSAKKEAEKSLEELTAMGCLKNEKDMALSNLQSEVDTLRAHCEELRHSLHEDELEKEKLRKQVTQLKAELKEKDDVLTTMERKLKDNNGRVMAAEKTKAGLKKGKVELTPRGYQEANSLKEQIKLLEGWIKQKETALENSANAFLEKEKDIYNKIEELEKRLEELNHSSTTYCEGERRKVDGNDGEFKLNAYSHKPVDNGNEKSLNRIESGDQFDLCALLKEMASLREKNAFMEDELTEMQDKYSEISLKFAEVEGERQKLVMTLRSIKNSKKR